MRCFVIGGAGFIASHVVDGYLDGVDVAIVDDLSRGSMNNVNPKARFYEADIRDYDAMRCIIEKERLTTSPRRANGSAPRGL
jgi:UDP-glucose 4-epimerase